MFITGDKIMVRGYESWGEGEITATYLTNYNRQYVTHFPKMGLFLRSESQDNFYQTLKQQLEATIEQFEAAIKPLEISFEFKNGSVIRPVQDNDNAYRSSGRGLTSGYTHIDDIVKIYEILNNKGDFNMPSIMNYKYAEDTAITTIEWSDGTKTTVHAEHPEKADPYTGFVTACAKKAFGNNNTINKLFDEWAVKKPARETKAKIKTNAAELEAKRITEKRKAKKEKWAVRRRAAEINREYEARKLAHEKYGVPMVDNAENGGK